MISTGASQSLMKMEAVEIATIPMGRKKYERTMSINLSRFGIYFKSHPPSHQKETELHFVSIMTSGPAFAGNRGNLVALIRREISSVSSLFQNDIVTGFRGGAQRDKLTGGWKDGIF